MPAVITINGKGNLDKAESTAGYTAFKISGSGGAPTAVVADGALEGIAAVTAVTNRQRIAIYYDLGAGNELNFGVGGAEEGQVISVLSQFLAKDLLNIQSSTGFGIFLSTGFQANYALFSHFGSDNYDGAPISLVIDPTFAPSFESGTFNPSSVRYVGVFADVGGSTARFDNLIMDRSDCYFGLKITGVSTDLGADILAFENVEKLNILKSLNKSNTATGLGGSLIIGDDTGTLETNLIWESPKLFLEEPSYFNGTSDTNSLPADFYSIKVVGNTTNPTVLQIGQKVGAGDTANGRSGMNIVGNETYNLGLSFDDGNVDSCKVYGSQFENVNGTISFGSNILHENIGNTFDNSFQVDIGSAITRNVTFSNHTGAGALLWNPSINIKNCRFINNSNDIEHNAAVVANYDNLVTTGSVIQANNTTSGPVEVVTVNGLNGTNFNEASSINVTIIISVILELYGMIVGSRFWVYNSITQEELFTGLADTSSKSTTFNYPGSDVSVEIKVRKSTVAPKYKRYNRIDTITLAGLRHPVSQSLDTLAAA